MAELYQVSLGVFYDLLFLVDAVNSHKFKSGAKQKMKIQVLQW